MAKSGHALGKAALRLRGGGPSKLKDASRGGAQPPQHEQLTSRGGCSTPPARTIDFRGGVTLPPPQHVGSYTYRLRSSACI